MRSARYPQVLLGVSFALLLLGLLGGLLAGGTVVRAQSATTPRPTTVTTSGATEPMGRLLFTDSTALHTGSFVFSIRGLPTPPAGSHYELWLHAAETPTLRLGALVFARGAARLQGNIGYNPLTVYDQALISLETDEDDQLSRPVLLTATQPAALRQLLFPLLAESENPLGGTDIISGLMTGAQVQTQLALKHTGFLREQLSKANLPEARRHTEHIINILDGADGAMYSDLDRNGQLQNPGDGIGVRVYLAEARTHTQELLALIRELDELTPQQERATRILAALQAGQADIPTIFEKAPKIFASDTVTEANGHAHELNGLIDDLAKRVTSAYTRTLLVAAYSFYPPATPLVVSSGPTAQGAPVAATPQASASLTVSLAALTPTLPATAATADHLHTTATVATPVNISVTVDQGWRNPADGSLYIRVPGGDFVMGATDEAATPREQPQHTVTVAEFWLQQTETTNSQYARCVAAGVCTAPNNQHWTDPAYAQQPITQIDWQQAALYAEWVGGRLPTEAEWEAACRGTEATTFPWGNAPPDETRANYNGDVGDTTPVGAYPHGATPLGIVDLSGNVWEWVSTLDARYPYSATDGREAADAAGKRVARGGSFYYTQYQIRCAARTGFAPTTNAQPIGVRVVIAAPTTRWRHTADEAFYRFIPGGEFAMGSTATSAISPLEEPRHPVTVGGFWLQETETTNAQYGRCVTASVCTPPNNDRWDDPAYAEHPVTHISWAQANAYAAWVGGRLPTEAEWEKACRGAEGRTYPWGEEPPAETISNYNNTVGDTTPVGSYPAGASAEGVLDLSGNVWEWVNSLETAYPYDAGDGREAPAATGKRSVRGGSFYYTQYQIRCAARTGFAPTTDSQPIGMRVVLDNPQ